MTSARPLRDVFADLAEHDAGGSPPDAAHVLAAGGHADLPDGLVAEAVVNYADTAPIEVAQHLQPYVMAHSPVPQSAAVYEDDPGDWLHAVSSAPVLPPGWPDVDPGYGYDPTAVHHHDGHTDGDPDGHDPGLHHPSPDDAAVLHHELPHTAAEATHGSFGTGYDPLGVDRDPSGASAGIGALGHAVPVFPHQVPVAQATLGGLDPATPAVAHTGFDDPAHRDPGHGYDSAGVHHDPVGGGNVAGDFGSGAQAEGHPAAFEQPVASDEAHALYQPTPDPIDEPDAARDRAALFDHQPDSDHTAYDLDDHHPGSGHDGAHDDPGHLDHG